jgi:hypothetical protein
MGFLQRRTACHKRNAGYWRHYRRDRHRFVNDARAPGRRLDDDGNLAIPHVAFPDLADAIKLK